MKDLLGDDFSEASNQVVAVFFAGVMAAFIMTLMMNNGWPKVACAALCTLLAFRFLRGLLTLLRSEAIGVRTLSWRWQKNGNLVPGSASNTVIALMFAAFVGSLIFATSGTRSNPSVAGLLLTGITAYLFFLCLLSLLRSVDQQVPLDKDPASAS